MDEPPAYAPQRNAAHLRLLFLAHYGVAATFLILSYFPFRALLTMMDFPQYADLLNSPAPGSGIENLDQMVDLILISTVAATGVLGVVHAILTAWSGWCISRGKWWTFSLAVAVLNLLAIPVGTVLSVFTIVVLRRGSVRALYGVGAR